MKKKRFILYLLFVFFINQLVNQKLALSQQKTESSTPSLTEASSMPSAMPSSDQNVPLMDASSAAPQATTPTPQQALPVGDIQSAASSGAPTTQQDNSVAGSQSAVSAVTPTPPVLPEQLKWPDTIELSETQRGLSQTSNKIIIGFFDSSEKILRTANEQLAAISKTYDDISKKFDQINNQIDTFLQNSSDSAGNIKK